MRGGRAKKCKMSSKGFKKKCEVVEQKDARGPSKKDRIGL
jgi:hypothetical protein